MHGETMKKSAYTQEEFKDKVSKVNPNITIVGEYRGVENKIAISCSHVGVNEVYAYTLLKPRNCCKKGYHENRVPALAKSIEDRKQEIQAKFGNSLIVDNIEFSTKRNKLDKIICPKHGEFSQWIGSLSKGIGCPQCGLEANRELRVSQAKAMRSNTLSKGKAKFVSKSETIWLDEIGVNERQVWLNDIQYRVDGFDQDSNTVYLYHGQFWHGCPDTFDPEMIHPILKVKMKQLYEQTIQWEQKIKDAGYNLITKWGK